MQKHVFIAAICLLIALHSSGQSLIFQQYLEFNGNDISIDGDYVQITDDPSLNFDASTSFTIQFWLNPLNLQTAANSRQGLVTKKTNSGIGYGLFWDVTGAGNGRFQLALEETGASGGSSQTISTPTVALVNSLGWIHLTAVVKRNNSPASDTAYIYYNGSLEVKAALNSIGDFTNSQPMRLMNYAGNTTNFCAGGRLDEVRIWNVALTEKQIQRFYSEPIEEGPLGFVRGKESGKLSILPWSNLAGYWPMEDLLGSVQISDESDNSNTGFFYEGNSVVACVASPCGPALKGGTIGTAPTAFIATTSGLWSSAATWGGNNPPNDSRHLVFINPGVTVTLDGSYSCEQINIKAGGTLTANTGAVLQVEKYFDCDGTLDCKEDGTILFDQVGDHKIFGEGILNFFNFTLFQNAQLQVETDLASPVNIYGVLLVGDGRIRTSNNMVLKVNKSNTSRPYGLISKSGVGIPDVEGTITMEKQLTSNNAGWRQMCLPLKGRLNNFTGLTLNGNSTAQAQQNVFFWDNAQDPLITANNVGWTSASANAGQGKAYSVYLDAGNFSFDPTLTFEGEYNFGDTTYTLTYYNDPGNPLTSGQTGYENGVGWNFIPNRYPSLLDVQQMIADNPLNYKPIHIWDANTQQYMAFTDNPNDFIVPYNNAGTTTAELAGAAIEPMQGFWVKTDNTENGASFTVQDAWRSVDFGLNPHAGLKTNTLVQINVFSAIDSAWDAIGFNLDAAASNQFDPKHDVYKIKSSSNVPSLYVEKDQRFLQIGQFSTKTNQLRLHFDAQPNNLTGLYYLNLERALSDDKVLIVEDLSTRTLHNLGESSYAFSASSASNTGRFIVHFVHRDEAPVLLAGAHNIVAFLHEGELVLRGSFISGPISLSIYDTTGRLLKSESGTMEQEYRTGLPALNGVVIIEVQHSKGVDRIKLTAAN